MKLIKFLFVPSMLLIALISTLGVSTFIHFKNLRDEVYYLQYQRVADFADQLYLYKINYNKRNNLTDREKNIFCVKGMYMGKNTCINFAMDSYSYSTHKFKECRKYNPIEDCYVYTNNYSEKRRLEKINRYISTDYFDNRYGYELSVESYEKWYVNLDDFDKFFVKITS